MVVMTVPVRLRQMFAQLTVCDRCRLQTGIRTGLIQSNRIKACKHSDIRKDRCIIFPMAVTVGADVLHKGNMEAGTAMTDCLGIFCHLPIQKLICAAVGVIYGIKAAGSDTAAAAFTFIIINDCFFIHISDRIASAFFCTTTAATAEFCMDGRFSAGMLLHLSCTASASHTNVLKGTAESGGLMAFKMGQTDKNIRIHNGMTDICCLAVLSVYDRNFYFIGPS